MALKDSYTLPAAADMHVHLRNAPGPIASLVTPTIRPAGIDTVFVMPNLAPRPVVSVQEALDYKAALQQIDPNVNYLMSLYLHESVTPDVIREAKKAGIAGVKVSLGLLVFSSYSEWQWLTPARPTPAAQPPTRSGASSPLTPSTTSSAPWRTRASS